MDWMSGNMTAGGWLVMTLFILLIIAAFWAIGFWLMRTQLDRPAVSPRPASERNARQLLDERLARGEIDDDTYSRLRELLENERTP